MTSSKPYLLDAFIKWIVDNQCTPHVLVDANYPGVEVPEQFIEDGRIVLNIAPLAVNEFQVTKELMEFDARFSGVARHLVVPMRAILSIYAHENGRGIVFTEEDSDGDDSPPSTKPPTGKQKKSKGASHLKLVK